VAFSYVWGRKPREEQLETTLKTLQTLQQPGALKDAVIQGYIPQEIFAAMRITRLLGQRYLWCDRFYIIQDDERSKAKQINNMAQIYSHAFLTIICMEDSFEGCGIRGIEGISAPKTIHGQDFKPQDFSGEPILEILKAQEHHSTLVSQSPWSRRGWTPQEMVFSQRALFFHPYTVTWECHCAIWHEGEVPQEEQEVCLKRFSHASRGLYYSPWPNFEEYASLVSNYSRRSLTSQNDILRAFAGITITLLATFVGGFHFGLPRLFFDVSLLWYPLGRNWTRKRRFRNHDEKQFPSWSWIGGNGAVELHCWRSAYGYIQRSATQSSNEISQCPLTHMTPIVRWHLLNDPET
jgi:Heterokaryon incompatibility protein (HET)